MHTAGACVHRFYRCVYACQITIIYHAVLQQSSNLHIKAPGWNRGQEAPHLGITNFSKTQLFDLKADLPHSLTFPEDWCAQI